MFRVIEKVCASSPHKTNEDFVFCEDKLLGVLDGATGLRGKLIRGEASDAAWFVSKFVSELRNAFSVDSNLERAVYAALLSVEHDFYSIVEESSYEAYELPSAGAVLACIDQNRLNIERFGDCEIYVQMRSGEVRRFSDSRLIELDQRSIEQMHATIKNGYSPEDARSSILEMLQSNRSKMNQPGGYSALSVGTDSMRYVSKISIDLYECSRIFSCSDGFAAAYRNYSICTVDEILSSPRPDLESVVSSIRDIEKDDPMLTKFPRLKQFDDVSALVAHVL